MALALSAGLPSCGFINKYKKLSADFHIKKYSVSNKYNAYAEFNRDKERVLVYLTDIKNPRCDLRRKECVDFHVFEYDPMLTTGQYLLHEKSSQSNRFPVSPVRAPLIMPPDLTNSRAKIALIVPDFTHQAYNNFGGWSFYRINNKKIRDRYHKSSIFLRRPNEEPQYYHNPLKYSPLEFIEKHFGKVDLYSQSYIDIHKIDLSRYKLIAIYGHDEYWTQNYRKTIENALRSGANLLNMSGNTCWWQLDFNHDILKIDRARKFRWHNIDPEEKLLGVSFRFAGYPIARKVPDEKLESSVKEIHALGFPENIPTHEIKKVSRGLRLLRPDHHLFTGTNLHKGDWFGVDSKILDIEIDGYPLNAKGDPEQTEDAAAVQNLELLAEGWTYYKGFRHSAVITTSKFEGLGRVVSLASIGWHRALAQGDKTVEKITYNAIKYLIGGVSS